MYNYQQVKPLLFSDEGQRLFLKCRDRVKDLLKASGAVRMEEAIKTLSGDSWTMLACLDRMVELGEIREIRQGHVVGQCRIFVAN
jgi:hypothetical protein